MKEMIWFDMDGTIADLYAVTGWLAHLENESVYPYAVAATMLNFRSFARLLNGLQKKGFGIGIISWTSKNGSPVYNVAVEAAKRVWLAKHLPSVHWDEIKIVPYGTNKKTACGSGILFDDEERNRNDWGEGAFTPDEIIETLRNLNRSK